MSCSVLADMYGEEVAETVTIQYGGSMNDGNAKELLSKFGLDKDAIIAKVKAAIALKK